MIFVFGSNKAGRHGKGAAKYAALNYGAVRGVGEGRTGDSYAIPTKGRRLEPLNFSDIESSIIRFLHYAKENHDQMFLLTPVGTGLAGHSKRDVWSVLAREGLTSNIVLSSTWVSNT